MLLVVGLLAACSDSESGSSDDAPEDTAGAPEEERDLAADQELADASVLTDDDVPTGFEEEPPDDDEDDEDLDQAFADCLGISLDELNDGDDEPQASSTFATATEEEVSSEVIVFATEEEVQEDLELWKDPATQDCFVGAMNEMAAGTEGIGEITMDLLDVYDLGEDAFGFGIAIPATQDGVERVLHLDVMLIRQGRTAITMGFSAFDEPFPPEVGYELAFIVADRVPVDA
jgi:hypothetical protein